MQLALLGLRVHSWWEAVEPRLPRSWAWAWAGLSRVSGARVGALGRGGLPAF